MAYIELTRGYVTIVDDDLSDAEQALANAKLELGLEDN
jgi:hypothetical protein